MRIEMVPTVVSVLLVGLASTVVKVRSFSLVISNTLLSNAVSD